MATSTDLINDVYDHFIQAYAALTAQGNMVIAFEPLGISPGLDPAAAGAAVTALEFVSDSADAVPDLTGGVFVATGRTVSGTYDTMLQAAEPSPSTDTGTFNAAKANAREIFGNATSGSQLGAFQYLPAFPSPANWFDPSVAANWSSYSYAAATQSGAGSASSAKNGTSGTSGTTSGTSGTVVRPPIRIMPPPWRLAGHPMGVPPVPGFNGRPVRALSFAQPVSADIALSSVTAADTPVTRPLVLNNDSAQPELATQFAMTFEYCLISLQRPWLSGNFLATPGWYVPGAHAGDYSTAPMAAAVAASAATAQAGTAGSSAAPTATAPAKAAPLSWIPVACIAVKNLSISAQGSPTEPVVGYSLTSFGPFSLSEEGSDGLKQPGIQIIAWICSAQPRLPPDTDPALIPPTTAQTIVKDTGVAVDIFQDVLTALGKK